MAGTVTITDQVFTDRASRPVRKLSLVWVSNSSGDVSGTLTDYISGEILRVVFIPGATSLQPSNNYDVTLLDQNCLDVLAGQGANLSDTSTTHVCPGVPFKDGTTTSTRTIAVEDKLELRVANGGNAKGGTVILYVR